VSAGAAGAVLLDPAAPGRKPSQWHAYLALVRWDWVRELKRKNTLITMVMLSVITLFLFSLATSQNLRTPAGPLAQSRDWVEAASAAKAGFLWVTIVLAGTVGVDRAFRGEGDGRLLEGLLQSPLERSTLYFGRLTSTYLFVLTLEVFTLPLFLLLFDQPLWGTGLLWVVGASLAVTLGFVAVGVLLSAMTWSLRGGAPDPVGLRGQVPRGRGADRHRGLRPGVPGGREPALRALGEGLRAARLRRTA